MTMRKYRSKEDELEDRFYRAQRRAVRDGIRDYTAWKAFNKIVLEPLLGFILFAIIFTAYIENEKVEIPKRYKKSLEIQAQKTLLLKQLKDCKKTGDPKRKECITIWRKWINLVVGKNVYKI
jgi:hypothetical protein